MHFLRNIRFWKKLVLINVPCLLLISVLIGGLSFQRAEQAAQESARYNIQDTLNRIDISINQRVRQFNKTVQVVAEQMVWTGALNSGPDTAILSQVSEYFQELFQEVQQIDILRGDELFFSTGCVAQLDQDTVTELYANAERCPGRTLWTDVRDGWILAYSGIQSGTQPDGLLVLWLEPGALGRAVFLKQKITDRQISFLLDRNECLIYSGSSIPEGLTPAVLDVYRSGRQSFQVELNDRRFFCCGQYNGISGWKTFIAIDTQELFPGAESLQRYIVALVSVCILLALVLSIWLSHLITMPLAELTRAMKRVQEDFDLQLENDRQDEIGELTDSFNYMLHRIRTLVNRVYREQLALKSAELEALQAQINPHFLYNSLDSINWMLIDRGDMDISAIVVALGKLMQYSMDSSTPEAPLSEEYRNIRDYMLIQKNRLEDQLDYVLELDPELEDIWVPKLILQPLVENAIKHGVLGAEHCCTVKVATSCRDGKICIKVCDDGVGMDREALERCRQSLCWRNREQKSIGLSNVARRLWLHYDGQSSMRIESKESEGTEITLLLPFSKKGEEDRGSDNR